MNSSKRDDNICSKFLNKCGKQNPEAIFSYYDRHFASIDKYKIFVFQYFVKKNYLELAKWYSSRHVFDLPHPVLQEHLQKRLGIVDALELACEKGHLDMAQWLSGFFHYFTEPRSKIGDNAFRKACRNKHFNIVEWLISSKPSRYSATFVKNEQDEITNVIPRIIMGPFEEMCECDISQCTICDEKSEIITFCKHQFCHKCIHQWLETQQTCPICRNELLQHQIFTIVPK